MMKSLVAKSICAFLVLLVAALLVFFVETQNGLQNEAAETTENITEAITAEKEANALFSAEGSQKAEKITVESSSALENLTVSSQEHINNSTNDSSETPLLASILEQSSYTENDIAAAQLIVVQASGNTAQVSLFEKNGEEWSCEQTANGWVGENGAGEKTEGDKKTPTGLFPIGDAFYIEQRPQTALNAFEITEDTYWVDDPNSAFYNQRVEGLQNKDWSTAERMALYTSSYKYGCVVEYNTSPVEKGKGSAIFLHCGQAPTAGCIAVEEDQMLAFLQLLDKGRTPYILIL